MGRIVAVEGMAEVRKGSLALMLSTSEPRVTSVENIHKDDLTAA